MNRSLLLGIIFLFGAIITAGFLIYSLLNMEKLNISIMHPRIIVETVLMLIFMTLAVYQIFIRE